MIDAAEVRKLCRSFWGSAETFPSGAKRSVFKVAGKISPLPSSPSTRSASASSASRSSPSNWCATYSAVIPGYHLDERWLAGAMSTRLSLLAQSDSAVQESA
jgi:hypothetical protein